VIDARDLHWEEGDGAFTLNGWRFATVHGGASREAVGDDAFVFFKTRSLVEQFLSFFNDLATPPSVERMVELGLYDGGSVPFWFEAFAPRKHVGIDLGQRRPTPYLEKYLSEGDRRERIDLHWGLSQADRRGVSAAVDAAFGDEPIDFVIDDASHLYEPSKTSFELLFPRLRPGVGWYLVEDWAWNHWPGEAEKWKAHRPLTRLIFDFVEMVGSTGQHLVRDVRVFSGFTAVRRSWAPREAFGDFALERSIYRYAE
jgi:hypothetical protein